MASIPDATPNLNRKATKSVKRTTPHVEKLNKPSSLQEFHAGDFMTDHNVQRALNEARVVEMAADFRPDSMGLITASRRMDGRLYILDGQHRIAAARMANYDGPIATREFRDLTIQEEAGLFLTLNKMRAVSTIERFKVRVTLGDRIAVNINKILTAYGLHVNFAATNTPNTISSIVTLEKVYRGAGVRDEGDHADLVDRTIGTLVKAYGGDTRPVVFSRAMVEGLGIFHATYGKQIDKDRLIEVLSAIPPRQMVTRARTRRDAMGGTLGENAAESILAAYNHRRRDKLPELGNADPAAHRIDPTRDPMYVDPAQYAQSELQPQGA